MHPAPPCSAPACWWLMWALGYFSAGSCLRHIICGFYWCIFPTSYVVLWDSKTPHRPAGERVSWCLETSPPSRLPPQERSLSLTLLSLFLSFIFCPTSFQRQWPAFWVPNVLFQQSEVVLWNLLSFQMIFWWICRGESDLPVLFLHHLRTSLRFFFFGMVLILVSCTMSWTSIHSSSGSLSGLIPWIYLERSMSKLYIVTLLI